MYKFEIFVMQNLLRSSKPCLKVMPKRLTVNFDTKAAFLNGHTKVENFKNETYHVCVQMLFLFNKSC